MLDEQPAPVLDLRLTREINGIGLVWSDTLRGTVRIHRVPGTPKAVAGHLISEAELAVLGIPLMNTSAAEAFDPSPPNNIAYYVPVTFIGDLAAVGSWRKYVPLPDVQGLVAEDFGDYIQLRWRWPDSCVTAAVAWQSETYPT